LPSTQTLDGCEQADLLEPLGKAHAGLRTEKAGTALTHLAAASEQYNERHPHKALKYRSPREFRRTVLSST